jgi:methionyl-tRNA formyltransferase
MTNISDKRILLFFGNDLRNQFILNKILQHYKNCKVVIQKRNKEKIKKENNELLSKHLKLRDISEEKILKIKDNFIKSYRDKIYIDLHELNSKKIISIVKKYKPHLVVCYGITLIKSDLLSVLPKKTINIHSGLTQKFRGYASNFWACYMLEPNNVGATIHYVTAKADSGNVIHQVRTDLKKNYNLHDLSSVAILKIGKVINKVIGILLKKKPIGKKLHNGKSFLLRDFNPSHLLLNYKLFDDKLSKFYLDKKMKVKDIKLIEIL